MKKQFETQGYTVIPQLFNQDELEPISIVVKRIYQQWLKENWADFIENQLINMHSLTHSKYFQNNPSQRTYFFELIAPSKLTDLIENLLGEGIYFQNTQLFFNPYQNGKCPYWHRDLQYSPIPDAIQAKEQKNLLTLHVRIPLVAEKGIELIPETHKRWDSQLESQVRLELNGHINSEELPGAILIELEPGDLLIFDAQMIHRGNYKLNQVRQALDICLGKQHSLTSGFLDESHLPNDEEIKKISNSQWYKLSKSLVPKKNSNII